MSGSGWDGHCVGKLTKVSTKKRSPRAPCVRSRSAQIKTDDSIFDLGPRHILTLSQ